MYRFIILIISYFLNCVTTCVEQLLGARWTDDLRNRVTDYKNRYRLMFGVANLEIVNFLARSNALIHQLRHTVTERESFLLDILSDSFHCTQCNVNLPDCVAKERHFLTSHHRSLTENHFFTSNFDLWLSIMQENRFKQFIHMKLHNAPLTCAGMQIAWNELKLVWQTMPRESYVYIVVDPTILPPRQSCSFLQFIHAVFYIGEATLQNGRAVRPKQHLDDENALANGTANKVNYIGRLQQMNERPYFFLIYRKCTKWIAEIVEDSMISLLICELSITNAASGKNTAGNSLTFSQKLSLGTQSFYRAYTDYVSGSPEARVSNSDFRKPLEDDTWDSMINLDA